MALPLEKFVQQLEDSGILAGDTIKDFLPPNGQPKDATELARELVRQKKLTRFQAEEVSKGKGKSLVLGNYILMEQIGAGGMGQVFKAEHRRMKRFVAIKVLPAATTKDKAAIARFEREVEAAAKITHPNIVAALDADCANGVHFLVMELVEGNDLSALVKKNGPFSIEKAVNYVIQAAKGLQAAHAEGIVHRDIKPANLLLDSRGTVKILDMGLARLNGDGNSPAQAELTSTGTIMGTVDYMAPEQALNTKKADARADIYALGCTLFYLLTGEATYGGDSLMEKLLAHRELPIPDLPTIRREVPAQIQAVFRKMVAKRVEDRYQSMTDVLADLDGCSTSKEPVTVTQQLPAPPTDAGMTDFFQNISVTQTQSVPKKKAAKPPSRKAGKDQKKWLLIGGGILGVLILLAGLMVVLRTKHGKLIVTVNEPDADVQVLNEEGKVEITRKGDKGPITIAVDPGKHRLKVQKDGFEIFSKDFEIESGGKKSITAKLIAVDENVAATEPAAPLATASPKPTANDAEWKALFDGQSLAGWTEVGFMTVENGVLVSGGKMGVAAPPGDFQDFEVEVEFRLANGGNSGLGICYGGTGDPSRNGLEIQMLDDEGNPNVRDTQRCGSIYTLAPAKPGHFKRWPEWNKFRVISLEDKIQVELNGVLVTDATRSSLQQANPGHAGVARKSGQICLFPHTGRSEYRNFRVRPAVPMLTKAPPQDAIQFNGHSYKFFSEVLDWRQAKTRCEELGGHLPIIETNAENDFVIGLAGKSITAPAEFDGVWLGATDVVKEGEWKWVNDEKLTFSKWNRGQPNNKQNSEHYLLLWLSQREWCDQPTRSTQHPTYLVCEWDTAPR